MNAETLKGHLDLLLLALSFAAGPFGWIGWGARAVALGLHVGDMAERQAIKHGVIRRAAA